MDKRVDGILIAERQRQAYKVLPVPKDSGKPFCCSKIPQPIRCGISRIWTSKYHRRKKIATRLVDAMR